EVVDPPGSDTWQHGADIESLCDEIGHRYIYLHERVAGWDRCRVEYAELAARSESDDAFLGIAEQVVGELYDHHAGVRAPVYGSRLLVPPHADLWVELIDDLPVVTSVRAGSPAAEASIVAGARVVSIGGLSVEQVLESSRRRLGPR